MRTYEYAKANSRIGSEREEVLEKAEEARLWEIPLGYSTRNWDCSERPILVVGSVFDGNSLGKWIFDWTACRFGPGSPVGDVAGELWLLLLALTVKVKKARQNMGRIREGHEQKLLEDAMDGEEMLWSRLQRVIVACEECMWKVCKLGKDGKVSLGLDAGVAFVECMFGRDGKLEEMERWMSAVRAWSVNFDKHCEEVLGVEEEKQMRRREKALPLRNSVGWN